MQLEIVSHLGVPHSPSGCRIASWGNARSPKIPGMFNVSTIYDLYVWMAYAL